MGDVIPLPNFLMEWSEKGKGLYLKRFATARARDNAVRALELSGRAHWINTDPGSIRREIGSKAEQIYASPPFEE